MELQRVIEELKRHSLSERSNEAIMRHQVSLSSLQIVPKTIMEKIVKWIWGVLFRKSSHNTELAGFAEVDIFGHEFTSIDNHEQEIEIL